MAREDPLEKGMATLSSILEWRIPWTEEPGGLQSKGLQRAGHRWATKPFTLSWCCLYKRTSWGLGLRQESATAETETSLQEGRGSREKGCENTLPLVVGLPCVCLAKLYGCKQVRVYVWGANPKGWGEQGGSPARARETRPYNFIPLPNPHYQEKLPRSNAKSQRVRQDRATRLNWILSCQTPSKNNRCYLTSITEPPLLVPLTKHIYFYSWLSPLPAVKSLGGCHRQGLRSSSVLTGQLITDGGEQAFQNPWWLYVWRCSMLQTCLCHKKSPQDQSHDTPKTRVPNLWDLMPDNLRWSCCSNNRNKMHNKCNVLESSRNHPTSTPWKNCLPQSQPLVPKCWGLFPKRPLGWAWRVHNDVHSMISMFFFYWNCTWLSLNLKIYMSSTKLGPYP